MIYSNRDNYLTLKQLLVLLQLKVYKGVIESIELSFEEGTIIKAVENLVNRIRDDMTTPYCFANELEIPVDLTELSDYLNRFTSKLPPKCYESNRLPKVNNTREMTNVIHSFPNFNTIENQMAINQRDDVLFKTGIAQINPLLANLDAALDSVIEWTRTNKQGIDLPQVLVLINFIELTEYMFAKFNCYIAKPDEVNVETYQEEEDEQG